MARPVSSLSCVPVTGQVEGRSNKNHFVADVVKEIIEMLGVTAAGIVCVALQCVLYHVLLHCCLYFIVFCYIVVCIVLCFVTL